MTFTLTSPTFAAQGPIPTRNTCDGSDLSPGLEWTGFPKETKTFALIVDDPDAPDPEAPRMVYVHWVLFNIPANVTKLSEGIIKLPEGVCEGVNDWGRTGYGGPCPPIGTHRYFFKLYALDCVLDITPPPTKTMLVMAMEGHILEQATLMGTYLRNEKACAGCCG